MKKNRVYVLMLGMVLLLCTGCGDLGQALQSSQSAMEQEETTGDGGMTAIPGTAGEHETDAIPGTIGESEGSGEAATSTPESTSTPTPTPDSIPEPTPEPQQMTLLMVGDMLMHTPVTNSGKQEDGSYNYDHIFAHVKEEIAGADVALVNQEVIIGGTELGLSGYPRFNAAFELGDALVEAGFDVVLHATNHTLDKGEQGVRNCLSFWQEKHPQIQVAGIYGSSEAQENHIVVVEENGIKVAILNYTYSTNGIPLPEDAPYLVDMLDKEMIKADVAQAHEQADFVIVCPHWGTEYKHEPDKRQANWVKFFMELEVDLVLGTHPHVIEPIEWVESESGHRMLVYYSIGNFVNATSGKGDGVANRMLGAMATVTLEREEDGSISITDYDALPVVSHVESGAQGVTVYPMEEYTEELALQNEIIKQDPDFSLAYLEKVWEEVMKEEVIPKEALMEDVAQEEQSGTAGEEQN